MNIEKSHITKLRITAAPALDPIEVYAEDIAPREGKITITCYGQSWTACWGGMGNRTLAQFFMDEHVDYLANCLARGIEVDIYAPELVKQDIKKEILRDRRKSFLAKAEARRKYDDIDGAVLDDDPWRQPALMEQLLGDEWWYRLPTKVNPNYQYLCRIIAAVKQAFAAQVAAAPDCTPA